MNILSLWFFDFVIPFRDFVCVFDMGFSICIFFILCFSVLYLEFLFSVLFVSSLSFAWFLSAAVKSTLSGQQE